MKFHCLSRLRYPQPILRVSTSCPRRRHLFSPGNTVGAIRKCELSLLLSTADETESFGFQRPTTSGNACSLGLLPKTRSRCYESLLPLDEARTFSQRSARSIRRRRSLRSCVRRTRSSRRARRLAKCVSRSRTARPGECSTVPQVLAQEVGKRTVYQPIGGVIFFRYDQSADRDLRT